MNKYEITKRIENFAPLETQESWDCSGWVVDVPEHDEISKIMLCLTVTEDIIRQAKENNCDMIISHHPLFFVKLDWKDINIYCAHTNLDLAQGGTTDCLIKKIMLSPILILPHVGGKNFDLSLRKSGISVGGDYKKSFLRYIETKISIIEFVNILKPLSPHMRYVNNKNIQTLHKIAFCAGSGAEFIEEAYSNGADALVTGDIKFHTALDSPIVLFDIGHFESEIGVLKVFENLINNDVEVIYSYEISPFNY
ncbi:Nif3-like dinuclear metal center hexameric protein [bacterium]|nr:Nif3-like dinuclear metal center hexameric protein [bacterium]